MSIWRYVCALAGYWWALMGGSAGIAVGALVSFGYIPAESVPKPWFWWLVSGACFSVATFFAWHHERLASVTLQHTGPRLLVEFIPGSPNHWRVTNSGQADAMNILADPIRAFGITVEIERIQRIAVGESVDVEFRTRRGNQYFGRSAHPAMLLGATKKGAELTTESVEQFMDAISEIVVPVRLLYDDPSGNRCETTWEMRWNGERPGRGVHFHLGPDREGARRGPQAGREGRGHPGQGPARSGP